MALVGSGTGPNSAFRDAPAQGIFPEYGLGSGQEGNSFFRTEPFMPGKPPGYQAALKKQMGRAKDLSDNFDQYSDDRFNPYANVERGKLDKTLRGVKNDFNSRGLLGSGLQGDAEAGERQASNSYLTGVRGSINQGLLGDLNDARSNAFDLASLMARGGPDTSQMQLDQLAQQIALSAENESMAGQAYGNLSSGVGRLGGAVLGGGKK